MPELTLVELVEVRDLRLDVPGSRTLVVRWSDGTTSEAVRFFADESLFSEGDLAAPAFEAGLLIRIPCPDDNYAAGVRRLKIALEIKATRPGRP